MFTDMEIVFLLAGLPIFGIGALIVVSEVNARRNAVPASGRVVGFSRKQQDSGDSFHTVAEFVGADGRRRYVESVVGSSVPLGKVDDAITVLLRADDPESATIQSSLMYILGGVMALLGAASCTVFFATFRVGWWSVATAVAVTLFGAYKLRSLILESDMPFGAWRETLGKALRARVYTEDSREQIEWAQPTRVSDAVRRQQRSNHFAWPVLILFGAALLFFGQHQYGKTKRFLEQAARTTGLVVELAPSETSDDVTYAPVVEFEQEGRKYRFKDSVGSNPPSHSIGDVVTVLYSPANPAESRIDHDIWNRLLPLLIGGAGALMALWGVWIMAHGFGRRQSFAGTPGSSG